MSARGASSPLVVQRLSATILRASRADDVPPTGRARGATSAGLQLETTRVAGAETWLARARRPRRAPRSSSAASVRSRGEDRDRRVRWSGCASSSTDSRQQGDGLICHPRRKVRIRVRTGQIEARGLSDGVIAVRQLGVVAEPFGEVAPRRPLSRPRFSTATNALERRDASLKTAKCSPQISVGCSLDVAQRAARRSRATPCTRLPEWVNPLATTRPSPSARPGRASR